MRRGFFVRWYSNYGRDLPWRQGSTNPYQFLITEVLLHQTKAVDVAKIWLSFFARFPSFESLLAADEAELLRLIGHLGFGNWRSRALKKISAMVIRDYNGVVPNQLEDLLKIPYVGPYTANAVLTFAFEKKTAIVDNNVLRLFSRYFGIAMNPDIRRSEEPWIIARKLLPTKKNRVKPHNYGLLDFTAAVCKPIGPNCEGCPLKKACDYGTRKLSRT